MSLPNAAGLSKALLPIVDRPRGDYVDRVGLLGTRRAPPDVGVGAKQDSTAVSASPIPPSAFRLPPSSPLPMTRAEMDEPRLGPGRHRLRHRRCLRRSSEFCDGALGPAVGGRRIPRGDSQPARLALLRTVAHVRQAAAVFCGKRRQHGFDDQPLHRQPQSAQRRCLQPRRPHRSSARSLHAGLLSATREAYKGVPIIAGGVEASLRRIAHYDYWSDKVRRSIVLDAKCDLLVYGMGERPIVEIAHQLAAGATVKDLRNLRGVAYRLGAKEAAALFNPFSPRPMAGGKCGNHFKNVSVSSQHRRRQPPEEPMAEPGLHMRLQHHHAARLRRSLRRRYQIEAQFLHPHQNRASGNQSAQRQTAGAIPRPRSRRCRIPAHCR